MRRMVNVMLLGALALLAAACQVVPGTGDQASDVESAQNFVPASIPGYSVVDAANIAEALSRVGVSGSVLTGNLPFAGAIAKLDDMIRCYQGVGAVAARVYTESDIVNTITTGIPKIGVVAVVNTTRVQRNLLQCTVNTGFGAQSVDAIQPCGSAGSFTINGENLQYVFAATTPELCQVFQSRFGG